MNLEGYGFRSHCWNAALAAKTRSRKDEGVTELGFHSSTLHPQEMVKKMRKRGLLERGGDILADSPNGGEGECRETLLAEFATAQAQVLVVLLIPQGADLSLSCLNLPGIHAQIPGPCRLLTQLILVKNSMAISSL